MFLSRVHRQILDVGGNLIRLSFSEVIFPYEKGRERIVDTNMVVLHNKVED